MRVLPSLLLSLVIGVGGCSDSTEPNNGGNGGSGDDGGGVPNGGEGGSGGSGGSGAQVPDNLDDALENYANIVYASYVDSLEAAEILAETIDDFVAAPTEEGLEAAQDAWRAAREPYLQTEVFRFYGGPIDNEEDGPEGLLNAWPLDEQHIDYVVGDEETGLVNDLDFEITKETLVASNETPGEKDIATGYHAIEFLLWGQDLSEDGPGARPYTDYVEGGTAGNQDRRGLYLTTTASLLLDNLQAVVDEWDPDTTGNYRETFVEGGEASLEKILIGMIVLSGFETGGERLQPALDAHDQENEHSCFSDNTHRDMVQDAVGVQNVCEGSYTRTDASVVSGVGICDLVDDSDAALGADLRTAIAASVTETNALQVPFDQEISSENPEGNARVQTAIDALFAQEALLEDVFRGWGFSVPQPE